MNGKLNINRKKPIRRAYMCQPQPVLYSLFLSYGRLIVFDIRMCSTPVAIHMGEYVFLS